MKFILDNWMLISVALVSGGLLLWPAIQGAGGGGLSPNQAVQPMNREKAVVVDVCEAEEFAAGPCGGCAQRAVEPVEGQAGGPSQEQGLATDSGVPDRAPFRPGTDHRQEAGL